MDQVAQRPRGDFWLGDGGQGVLAVLAGNGWDLIFSQNKKKTIANIYQF